MNEFHVDFFWRHELALFKRNNGFVPGPSIAQFWGPSGFVVGLASSSEALRCDRVPCFTALRARVSTECWHAYASVTVLGKSREHVFLSGFLELTYF